VAPIFYQLKEKLEDENYEVNKWDGDKEENNEFKDEKFDINKLSKYIDQNKFIENTDISFSSYSDEDVNNDNNKNSNIDISNFSIGMGSNEKKNIFNMKEIKMECGKLNLFTIENFKNTEYINQFLINI